MKCSLLNSVQQLLCICVTVFECVNCMGESVKGYIYKCKKHFIKMLKDVGMVVPKMKETRL